MFFGLLAAIFVLASGAANVQASSGMHEPKIEQITQVTKTSVVVPFKIRIFAGEKVSVLVFIKNADDGSNQMEKMYTASLDGLGNGSVTVTGLMPGTSYSFKVQVDGTNFSTPRGGMTAS